MSAQGASTTGAFPLEGADRCPRCGGGFHCGAQDAAPCPCTGFTLTPAVLDDLRRRYQSCLCLACLAQLAAEPPKA